MNNLPEHVGIIMDGNRRWAKERGLGAFEGHREGLEALKRVAKHAANSGVKFLTVFAFSKDNWGRHKREVSFLFSLFRDAFDNHIEEIERENIGIIFMGDTSSKSRHALPRDMVKKMEHIENRTCKLTNKMILIICLNYDGRDEIIRAFEELFEEILDSAKAHENTSFLRSIMKEKLERFKDYLDAGEIKVGEYPPRLLEVPDVDLLIRTSGEQRISGFLIWQAAYAELYFAAEYWPDFTEEDFDKAMTEYSQRERRLGK